MDEKVVAFDENGKAIAGKYSWKDDDPWYKKIVCKVMNYIDNNKEMVSGTLTLLVAYLIGRCTGKAHGYREGEKDKVEFTDTYLRYITPVPEKEYVLKRHEPDNSFTRWSVDEYISENYDLTKKEEEK